RAGRRKRLFGDPADLVGSRDARLHALVQADDSLHQTLRPGRAAGDVDVDGDDLVDALKDGVVVEHAAGASAGAHRDHPLRLEHLVVDLLDRRGHLLGDAAGDDQQVGLARRGTERLHPETRDVVARRDDRHHLDRATGEPERVRPHRLRLRPGDRLLERGQPEPRLDVAELLLEVGRALSRPEDALGLDAEPGEPGRLLLLYCHSRAPLRQTYTYATSRISRKKANSAKPNQASWCRTTPSG